jgi:hypothetical protein
MLRAAGNGRLIVEDEPLVGRAVERALQQDGHLTGLAATRRAEIAHGGSGDGSANMNATISPTNVLRRQSPVVLRLVP